MSSIIVVIHEVGCSAEGVSLELPSHATRHTKPGGKEIFQDTKQSVV